MVYFSKASSRSAWWLFFHMAKNSPLWKLKWLNLRQQPKASGKTLAHVCYKFHTHLPLFVEVLLHFRTKDSSTVLSKVMTLHQGPVLPRWCCNSDSPKPLHTLETWLSSTILVGLRLPGLSILFMHILEFLHTNQYQSIERMSRWLVLHLLHLGEVAFPGIKTNIRCLGNGPTHVTVQTFPASTSDLANPKVTRSGG